MSINITKFYFHLIYQFLLMIGNISISKTSIELTLIIAVILHNGASTGWRFRRAPAAVDELRITTFECKL